MPESRRHRILCGQLFELLMRLVAPANAVGNDQFVYYDGEHPKRCVAPDAFVKIGVRDWNFRSWKTWEHGSPELAIEVLSPSDTREYLTVNQKLARYRALGVRELVVFNFDLPVGKRLRVYDRIANDLVERVVARERTPCVVLSELLGSRYDWHVAKSDHLDAALRLDSMDGVIPTFAEEVRLGRARERALQRELAKFEKKR
jgi:Uma2 family endonuclease